MLTKSQNDFLASFFTVKIDHRMVDIISKKVGGLIRLSPPTTNAKVLPFLPYFVAKLASESHISPAVLFVALYYIERLRKRLAPDAWGMACTGHRIVLAAFIVAEKFLCDIPMKNKSWAIHAKHFQIGEINLMERQLLELLVNGEDLYDLVVGHWTFSHSVQTQAVTRPYPNVVLRSNMARGGHTPRLDSPRHIQERPRWAYQTRSNVYQPVKAPSVPPPAVTQAM